MQKQKRRTPLLYNKSIFSRYGKCERTGGRKRFHLDINQRGRLKPSLEFLCVWRVYLQMFHFSLEINEAFVSFQTIQVIVNNLSLLPIFSPSSHSIAVFFFPVGLSSLTRWHRAGDLGSNPGPGENFLS